MRYALFFLIAQVGCSGGSDAGGGAQAPSDASVADAATADTSTVPADAAPRRPHEAGVVEIDSGPDAGDTACSAAATRDACMSCCQTKHAGGADTIQTALLACACKTAHCATACATSACAATPSPPDAGDPCLSCIQASIAPDAGASGCGAELEAACLADAVCAAYAQCTMGCEGKP